jgi:hypothetical protein
LAQAVLAGEVKHLKPQMYVARHPDRPGWLVHITGVKGGRYFSDRVYGGRLPALREANKYAVRITDKRRVNRKNGRWLHRSRSSGVFRFVNLRRKNKPAMWIAVACLETGRAKRRYFYVTKYGEREARRLAELARAEMVKQILG